MRAKRKIPAWVWVLTISGVVLTVGIYVAIYFGYSKVMEMARADLQRSNPDFEMLYFSSERGKVKVRHRASKREFLVTAPAGKRRIALRELTTKEVNPAPSWLQLKDAGRSAKGGWDRAGDPGMLREALDDRFADQDFVIESQDDSIITACNSKLLQCAVIAFGFAENTDNRAWYSASFFEAP